MRPPPLNGTKTHPLTPHALAVLQDLKRGPVPRQEINAGVINRLQREDLVESVDLPSPYKSHRGGLTPHLRLTAAGIARVAEG